MDFRAGLAALVFNAVMLVLALWQKWSVAVVLLSYVIESIFVMVAYQIHAAGKGGKISQKNAGFLFVFFFVNHMLMLFMFFTCYLVNADVGQVALAIAACFFGVYAQFSRYAPSSKEVLIRLVPPIVAIALLWDTITYSSKNSELLFVLVGFYAAKGVLEAVASVAYPGSVPAPVIFNATPGPAPKSAARKQAAKNAKKKRN